MQLIEKVIKSLKPSSYLKLGSKTSYLDDIIKEGFKSSNSNDLIIIDCEKTHKRFSELLKEALTKVSSKGIIVVNGGCPFCSAMQDESKSGKLWYHILNTGKEAVFYNDNKLGLSFIKNKDVKIMDGLNPDFLWFYFNVKKATEDDIIKFVTPPKKRKVNEVL